ncbi:MAG: cation diffusion facilitator family transporter [Eubacteriales bacterium]
MITILTKLFIPHYTNYTDHTVRANYGMLCGAIGILLNILLFTMKFFIGIISHSVAITADAFNNLTDAGSSIITLVGFKLSTQKADSNHPFGHGRFEYISGFLVSLIIIVVSLELLESSIRKTITPNTIEFNFYIVGILICSILIKLYMAWYHFKIASKISSTAMKTTATDCITDCLSTFVILCVTVTSHYITIPFYMDGVCGIIVALFILYSGFSTAKDTMNLLLGQAPSKDFIEQIHSILKQYPQIIGTHDLMVHDYGPCRLMITLHAEVSSEHNIMELHDIIDQAERQLNNELSCMSTIHMDPLKQNDPETQSLQFQVLTLLKELNESLSIHDFRIVAGTTNNNLIFDIAVPFSCNLSDQEIESYMIKEIASISTRYHAVICIDHNL